jgi:hypothetical protein
MRFDLVTVGVRTANVFGRKQSATSTNWSVNFWKRYRPYSAVNRCFQVGMTNAAGCPVKKLPVALCSGLKSAILVALQLESHQHKTWQRLIFGRR